MPGMSIGQMPSNIPNVTLNPEAFDNFIKAQGIRMRHQRPVPCPNVKDIYAPDHNPGCNECFNGFLYYGEKEFTGAFFGNDLDRQFNINGIWDLDTAMIIVPIKDSSDDLLDIQYFDQILLIDAPLVRYYQRVEHSQSGIDRLQFPASSVDFVVDASFKRYRPGIDFVIELGRIKWVGQRPGFDTVRNRGVTYSVNYYIRPVFTVIRLPHQLRIAQTQTVAGQPNVQARFPQLAVCRKDFIPFDRTDHIGEPDRPEPSDGSFR